MAKHNEIRQGRTASRIVYLSVRSDVAGSYQTMDRVAM